MRSTVVLLILSFLFGCTKSQTTYVHDGKTTYCWRSNVSIGALVELNAAEGTACPVQLTLDVAKLTVKRYEKIKVEWTAQYTAGPNPIQMNALTVGSVPGQRKFNTTAEITLSHLHSCAFGSDCDPFNDGEHAIASTEREFKNFTRTTTPWSAEFSTNDWRFEELGVYSFAVHLTLPGPSNTQFDIVVYQKMTVIQGDDIFGENYIHDKKTVYCFETDEDYRVKSPKTESIRANGKGLDCPLEMNVESPNFISPGSTFTVSWTTRVIPAINRHSFSLPSPLLTDTDDYQIVHSNIHGCFYGSKCNPFRKGRNSIDATSNQRGNFKDHQHRFTSKEIVLNVKGSYTMLAHIIIIGPANTRFDFVTYFQVRVQEAVNPIDFQHGQGSTYCWVSGESYKEKTLSSGSILKKGEDDTCPVTLKLEITSNSGESVNSYHASWTLTQKAPDSNQIVTLKSAQAELVLKDSYVVWQSNIQACKQDSNCSPFSSGENPQEKTPTQAGNFSNGVIQFDQDDIVFSDDGKYSVFAHIIIPLEAGRRFDVAAYHTIRVGETNGASATAIVGIVFACIFFLIGIVLVIIIAIRRKREKEPSFIEDHLDEPWRQYSSMYQSRSLSMGHTDSQSTIQVHMISDAGPSASTSDAPMSIYEHTASPDILSPGHSSYTSNEEWKLRDNCSIIESTVSVNNTFIQPTRDVEDDWSYPKPPPSQFSDSRSEYEM